MKSTLSVLTLVAASVAATAAFHSPSESPETLTKDPASVQETTGSQLITLWAKDSIACSFDVTSGRSGSTILDGQLDLSNATVAYDVVQANSLSLGLARDSTLSMVNLGEVLVHPKRDPRARGFRMPASAFHTLRVERNRIVYDAPGARGVELSNATAVLRGIPGRGAVHVAPKVGDIILMRYFKGGRHSKTPQLAKFLIVDHEAGKRVVLRWATLN